ncbi:alpha/beta hydrolase [Nocardia caishijiensis]|uniref:Serine aminopeptidase S33 family n=1 Tax=Nocardia caishijiensis TaxID=184756 RepID=A0ABQ6YKH9_9NOCA|nr:alpha/beta fold hydrolase [Nocardia caishijiensis]KAF0846216.1 serine aminopeptidase S33 family [Nocardia caishijiensis]
MPYFDSARGRLHYRRRSLDPVAATVVLLPGTGQHSGHYHRFGAALAATGIALWTLDTSGQGLSEGDPHAPGTLAELVADARGLLEVVRGDTTTAPVLMGHSLGAVTALAFAADQAAELRGLVLSGTPRRATEITPNPRPPTLAVHGIDDRRAPIDAVRLWTQRCGSVDLREYADAGHDLLHEPVRDRVADDIARWVLATAG